MIVELVFISLSIIFLTLRIIFRKEISSVMVMIELLSGVFFTLAVFFFMQPTATTTITNYPPENILSGNSLVQYPAYITNTTEITGPNLNSWQPIMIYMAWLVFVIVIVVMMVRDVIPLYFSKSLRSAGL